MTIIQAIKSVLLTNQDGLTSHQIYEKIVEDNLYSFGAKDPRSVVNGIIRMHCVGIDFPTARPVKYFKIAKNHNSTNYYTLNDTTDKVSKVVEDAKNELLPEEKILRAYQEHCSSLKMQLLDIILSHHPDFFEHLVVDLLLKMGYGYDDKSGIVTGGAHDGGIDGIINEDKLGLDLIYLQAKRYDSNNKVGRKEVQAFVGAMENIQKGVFITTSFFTKEASQYIEKQQQKSVRLIDGGFLADLMIKYEVGVSIAKALNVLRIDLDYFEE